MYDSVEAMWLGGRFGVLDLIKSQPILWTGLSAMQIRYFW